MTQDNDDLLAQVFSVLPPMEHTTVEHHEINGNNIKEESKEYLNANVRRVSNAFQDFLEKSGVVETNFQSVTESHSESHFQTTHVETHHEVITSHHEEHHHEEQHIGHGASFESHTDHHVIGSGAIVHEEEHHSVEIGNGVSLVSGEQLPPGHEHFYADSGAEVSEGLHIGSGAAVVTEESYTIGHGAEVHEDHHIGNGAAFVTQETAVIGQGAQISEESFGIGHGAVPQQSYQEHTHNIDDKESVISVRTGLSQATSVSVHSSVSQKSVQAYSEAPVKPPSSRHSAVSQKSASTLKETVSHTHDKESTISLSSVHSNNSTLTGTETAIQSYVVVEKSELIDAQSELSTPVAPLKSAPHDAVIQEFKQLHHREPSEVSVPPVPTSSPPPLDEEDSSSQVIKTMRVTEFEFDSNHIKNTVLVERHQEHHHSQEHEHHHNVDQYEHQYEEPQVLHYEETHTHVPIGAGVQVQHHEEHAIGEGVQLTGYHHHESEDEFKFEQAEYVEQSHVAVENSAHSVVSSVVAKADPPPVFFQSPVLSRRVPSNVPSHVESDSDDDTITGSTHHHEHHEHHQHHQHHEDHHHHHEQEFRELIPNINRAHVRDLPRPAHVTQETTTVTVVKTGAPIAHVTPVVSQVEVQHSPATIEVVPVVQTHLHEHHGHEHHHHHEQHEGEKHYHKHNDQLEEVFSGPSVRDLKSKFEQGGKVEIHYSTHYISHHDQQAQEIEHVHLKHEHEHQHAHEHSHEHKHEEHVAEKHHQHEHELVSHHQHDHHHHHHEQHSHHDHHHQDQRVVVQQHEVHAKETSVVPHLPHRESHKQAQEEVHVHQHEVEHKQHHHRHHHHHHHHDKHHEHKHRQHRHHHHEHDHHHHHEHVDHVHQQVEAVQVQKHVEQESVVEHHHHEHHAHHEVHHQHEEVVHTEHVYIEHAVEEEQLPVSLLLSKYGGGAKLRRPDHVEEIKIYSTSVVHQEQEDPVVHMIEPVKSRTVTQSSVTTATTRPSRSATACSVQSCKSGTTCQSGQRSHSSTLTQNHVADVHHVATTPVVPAAPVAAARSSSSDHQSVRVVKSVRAFVSQWGQKDFQPPSSPVITVPRLPSSPQQAFFPEPTSRKSTVVIHTEQAAVHDHHAHDTHAVQKNERAQSVAYSERSVAKSVRSDVSARSVATSEATSVATSNACECCSVCGKSKASRATSKASSKRSSVASEASTVTTTTYSVHKAPQEFVEPAPVSHVIPEVHEEFVLTPLSERRALFEQGINRGYSIRRNLHGDLRPMVNVFTD